MTEKVKFRTATMKRLGPPRAPRAQVLFDIVKPLQWNRCAGNASARGDRCHCKRRDCREGDRTAGSPGFVELVNASVAGELGR